MNNNIKTKNILVLILIIFSTVAYAKQSSDVKEFDKFIMQVKREALAKGISQQTVDEAFHNVKHLHRVIHKDRNQPEFKLTFTLYSKRYLTNKRIAGGKERILTDKQLLTEIGKKYHVQPEYFVALWGIETNYGTFMGEYPVISALATLSFDKRRSQFFKKELFAALKILNQGRASYKDMYGSWAGAMGQCQFMPTRFLDYAVDYTKSGKADIWHNKADALASTANYLHQSGWNDNYQMVKLIKIPKKFNKNLVGWKTKKTLGQWHKLGIDTSGVEVATKLDKHENRLSARKASRAYFSILQPDGKKGSAYLVYRHNFNIIMHWNKSHFYVLTVGLLANEVVG